MKIEKTNEQKQKGRGEVVIREWEVLSLEIIIGELEEGVRV